MNGIIRKISVGPDYKGGAMHYIVGQKVLDNKYRIHQIIFGDDCIVIYIIREGEIYAWKSFTQTMPISIEYNINF